MKTNCSFCNKIFDIFPYKLKKHKNVFCSTVCQHAFKENKVDLTCRICSTSFKIQKSRAVNQKECFCSKRCADIALMKPTKERECANCKETFHYLESRTKHSSVKFCSMKCCKEFRKPIDNCICSFCNKSFNAVKSAIERGRGKFCSKECVAKFYESNTHPNHKHGSSFFKKASKVARGDMCKVCRNIGKTEVHHIDGDHFNNIESNYITLCRTCHMRTHSISGKEQVCIKKALNILKLIIDLPKSEPATKLLVQKLAKVSLEPVDD